MPYLPAVPLGNKRDTHWYRILGGLVWTGVKNLTTTGNQSLD